MPETPSLMNETIAELVAIGAAVAANCEPCFRHHFDVGRKLGLSKADIRKAVEVALVVKAAPHRKILETVDRYLAEAVPTQNPCSCASDACC